MFITNEQTPDQQLTSKPLIPNRFIRQEGAHVEWSVQWSRRAIQPRWWGGDIKPSDGGSG